MVFAWSEPTVWYLYCGSVQSDAKADKCRWNRFVENNQQSRGTKQSLATSPPCVQEGYGSLLVQAQG